MASSIIGGLISAGWGKDRIRVSDPDPDQRHKIKARFDVDCFENNRECIDNADIVVFATKPQTLRRAVESVNTELVNTHPLLISIAAGIQCRDVVQWLGATLPLVRVMPNTPALINQGVSGVYATASCTDDHKQSVEQIMQAVGEVVWVQQERDIDTVTAISGSGPAYFYKLMEVMIEVATTEGLSEQAARTLVLETAKGAAIMAAGVATPPAELRKHVTSPGGTTEAALSTMESLEIDKILSAGMIAAIDRSKALAKTLREL